MQVQCGKRRNCYCDHFHDFKISEPKWHQTLLWLKLPSRKIRGTANLGKFIITIVQFDKYENRMAKEK